MHPFQMTAPRRFQVGITGELESGSFPVPLSSGILTFSIIPSNPGDWNLVNGETSGTSLLTRSSSTELIWNLPIQCDFSTTSPSGWPRVIVTIFSSDWFGRDVILGYGCICIPTQPGRHTRSIALFAPEPSTWWSYITGWLFGKHPRFTDPAGIISQTSMNKDRIRVKPIGGTVFVNINICLKDTEQFNLVF